jgi:hypothetical protein
MNIYGLYNKGHEDHKINIAQKRSNNIFIENQGINIFSNLLAMVIATFAGVMVNLS